MPIPAAFSTWMRGVRVWAALLGAGLVLAGLLWAGQRARDRLYDADRYTLPFADIDCDPPVGHERAEFLGEVQYLAGMPTRLHLLDHDLPARLADAFARHPLVEEVRRVEIMRPRGVRVSLSYRHGNLDGPRGAFEYDVRPRDGALHGPVRPGEVEKADPKAGG